MFLIIFIFCLGYGNGEVYLTVSSLYRDAIQGSLLIDRELQINWDGQYDKIEILKGDPNNSSQKVFQIVPETSEGILETNVTLGNPMFPNGWDLKDKSPVIPGDHCLPFWIVGHRDGKSQDVDCIKIRPTWMQDNRLSIRNLPLTSLFIPGTHNSGCYKRGGSLSQRQTTGRYILTQDQSIWSQLVYGIRYLDFRIGYYPPKNSSEESDSSFWINHDLIKIRPLVPLVNELKEFLRRAKDEIVVLDLHRFPIGFSNRPQRHVHFVKYLERELKPFAIPYTNPSITLDSIWEKNQRLIISYGENDVQKEFDWLWPAVRQVWGNKQSLSKLYEFLDSVMKNETIRNPARGLWAAMAQLTPGPLDLLFNPKGSLREMAHEVNANLTKWCRDWKDKVNIVTSDFFLETDIIDIAVAANVKKGNGPQMSYTTI